MSKEEKVEVEKSREMQQVEPAHVVSPFEEMERMFDNFFERRWLRPFHKGWPAFPKLAAPFKGMAPSVDIIDRDDEVVVKAELPGVDKKDLEISVTQNTVTIKGTTSHEVKEEKGDYYRCEITRGSCPHLVIAGRHRRGKYQGHIQGRYSGTDFTQVEKIEAPYHQGGVTSVCINPAGAGFVNF